MSAKGGEAVRTLQSALADKMKNPEFRAEYEALKSEFVIMQAAIDAQLAGAMNMRQKGEFTQQ